MNLTIPNNTTILLRTATQFAGVIGIARYTALSRIICGIFMCKIQFSLCETEWKSLRTRQVRIAGMPIQLSLAPNDWHRWSEVLNLYTETYHV